jgi:hypothetical protein
MTEHYEHSSLVKKCAVELRDVPGIQELIPESYGCITVLVANDTAEVRARVHHILAKCGYRGAVEIVQSDVPIAVLARTTNGLS